MADEKPVRLERPPSEKNGNMLPGEVSVVDGKKVQDGYGEWPTCATCGEQVNPPEFNNHTRDHENALRHMVANQ